MLRRGQSALRRGLRIATGLVWLAMPASADLPRMAESSPFNLDVSQAAVHPESSLITDWLETAGGFGFARLQIDFSIDVVEAGEGDPSVDLTPIEGYYEDCDPSGTIPLPAGGTVEGNVGYQCLSGGDCHLIVHDPENALLYEAWQADVTDDIFEATCLVEWKLLASYPPSGRGEGCTSADAAGFPIAPLLFDADEVAAGSIDHAIRFVLPNSRMRAGQYVHPASHYGGPTAASDSDAPIYGMRFRLKSSFSLEFYSPAAQVVLEGLKKYGMFLADGGSIALTARSDRGTQNTWADVELGSRDLEGVLPSDFEVLEGFGPDPTKGPYEIWPDCVKNTITVPEPGLAAQRIAVLALLAGLAGTASNRRRPTHG